LQAGNPFGSPLIVKAKKSWGAMGMVLLRPIGLFPPLSRRAFVTEALMVAIFLMALVQWISLHRTGRVEALDEWLALLGYVPARPRWWAWLTALLVHANALHLSANLLGLWLFARYAEALWGSGRWALFAAITQVLALSVQTAMMRRTMPDAFETPIVGASVLVVLAMGAVWVGFPDASLQVRLYRGWRWQTHEVNLPLRWLIVAWLLWQTALTVRHLLGQPVEQAIWAHWTGWGCGWLFACVFGGHLRAKRVHFRRRAQQAEAAGHWDEAGQWWERLAQLPDDEQGAAWLMAASAFLQGGDLTKTQQALQEALRVGVWSETALVPLRRLLASPRWEALPPSLLLALAEQAERKQWGEEALALFEWLSERGDFDRAPYALLRAAELCWRQGERERALHALHRFWFRYADSAWRPLAEQLASQFRIVVSRPQTGKP
jgi:membrane associated rhomboid family serine protease